MSENNVISREEILRIAQLAKLELHEDQINLYVEQMNTILNHVGQLEKLDVSGVEPLSHVLELMNKPQPDIPVPSSSREEILQNAPKNDGDFFIVPEIIKKEA